MLPHEADNSSLGHLPGARWEFDRAVTDVFGDMLRRSIPQYDVMRQAVFEVGAAFVQPSTHIADVGCSRGDALAPFIAEFGAANCYVGMEVSVPMLEVARARFSAEIEAGYVRIEDVDLRCAYPRVASSLTLCILTLQFVPLEHRQRLLRDIYDATVPGGALVLVEKILGAGAELSRMMIHRYHDYKACHGYSMEEIERKRLALEGVLVPVPAQWNEEMLRSAGFRSLDCFWRWMNFAGWVALKD